MTRILNPTNRTLDQPKTTQAELVNVLKASGSTATKNTIANTQTTS